MKKRALSILLVLVLALSLTTTALAAGLPFKDVPSNAWYYEAVDDAYNLALINGRDETHFAPDANLTYAEAVKLAACMNQMYYYGYVDLESTGGIWYQEYVNRASSARTIPGTKTPPGRDMWRFSPTLFLRSPSGPGTTSPTAPSRTSA